MKATAAVCPTKILVIDDEPRIRDACSQVLSAMGFQVATAADGSEGLQIIDANHYDIILVDLMMPNVSGFDVLSKVREHHPDTVVIVITGYATLEHSIEAMKKGAFDFIPKPFTPDQLRTVVDKSLKYTRALQDIADSKSRLKVMVNRLTEGVMTTDVNKLIVQANPAFQHMIGYHGEEIIGCRANNVIKDEQILAALDEALQMPPQTYAEINNEILLNIDGSEKYYSVRTTPFRSRDNGNIGTITVLHDVTAIKQMEQMKSDFVSMVAHEIRSPLNSLLMQLKNLHDGLAGEVNNKQQEILGRASDKIKNLNNLVTDLLDLAKIESGLIGDEKEKIKLCELLQEQVRFHTPYGTEKNIAIALNCPVDLPGIWGNRQNLDEVFSNLITNAIKYSPQGASVSISASKENEYLKIGVSDTGFGIEEEYLDKIFSRFFRVKDQNTRTINGTGLGLAIVKSIIEAHHGSIKVTSQPGQGTSFIILLPVGES